MDMFIRGLFSTPLSAYSHAAISRIELIVHIAISVLPGTNLRLGQVKHVKVKCLGKDTHIETMAQRCEESEALHFLKTCLKWDETKFPYFISLTWLSKIRNQEFRLYI